jgi:hypothetical protein
LFSFPSFSSPFVFVVCLAPRCVHVSFP